MLPKPEEYSEEIAEEELHFRQEGLQRLYFYEVTWNEGFHTQTELFTNEKDAQIRCMEIARKYIAILKTVYFFKDLDNGYIGDCFYWRICLIFHRGSMSKRVLICEETIKDTNPQLFEGKIPEELLKQ